MKPCYPPDSQPSSDTDDGQPDIHHDPSDTESSSTDDEPIQPVLLPVAEDTTKKQTPLGNVTGPLPDNQIAPSSVEITSPEAEDTIGSHVTEPSASRKSSRKRKPPDRFGDPVTIPPFGGEEGGEEDATPRY